MKIGIYRFSSGGFAAGGYAYVLTMKSDTRPLCGLCGERSPHKLKRRILLSNDVNYNRPVADFFCPACGEEFELKSKAGETGGVIADGAYSAMIARIQAENNPNFFFLNYDQRQFRVHRLTVVPKHFFTADIIEKRKPLAKSARRAGWVGCNIHLHQIPDIGKIDFIVAGQVLPAEEVVEKYKKTVFLSTYKADLRGWLLDTLKSIEKMESPVFPLEEVYGYAGEFQARHPHNHHVKDKIRQQLQILRDRGLIEFMGHGRYRKLF